MGTRENYEDKEQEMNCIRREVERERIEKEKMTQKNDKQRHNFIQRIYQ